MPGPCCRLNSWRVIVLPSVGGSAVECRGFRLSTSGGQADLEAAPEIDDIGGLRRGAGRVRLEGQRAAFVGQKRPRLGSILAAASISSVAARIPSAVSAALALSAGSSGYSSSLRRR